MSVKTFKSEFPLNERKQITGNVKKKNTGHIIAFFIQSLSPSKTFH
jgi:hypothetical protein